MKPDPSESSRKTGHEVKASASPQAKSQPTEKLSSDPLKMKDVSPNVGHEDGDSVMEHAHDSESIRQRIRDANQHSYLKDFVYGAVDGTVTTFAIVSGVAGAGLPSEVIIILGVANLVGDGFSMAAANYLGCQTERQLLESARAMENRHIRDVPDSERDEVRQIYSDKGFAGDDLDKAVDIITADRKRWVDTMLVDELGLSLHPPSPTRAAITTFIAFCLAGSLPLLAFICGFLFPSLNFNAYMVSLVLTAATFFLVGAAKSAFVEQNWSRAGLETLIVGAIASGLAYAVAQGLKTWIRH